MQKHLDDGIEYRSGNTRDNHPPDGGNLNISLAVQKLAFERAGGEEVFLIVKNQPKVADRIGRVLHGFCNIFHEDDDAETGTAHEHHRGESVAKRNTDSAQIKVLARLVEVDEPENMVTKAINRHQIIKAGHGF